jgi:hypothetical protein
MHITCGIWYCWHNRGMHRIRTATFWIAAAVLPGGLLLLVPKAFKSYKRIKEKRLAEKKVFPV